jgi:hypothetical protein
MSPHRLIDIHRVKTGRVETGQPHVADDHNLKRIIGIAETLGEPLASRLVPNVRLPFH